MGIWIACLVLVAPAAAFEDEPRVEAPTPERCARLEDDAERLACFDAAMKADADPGGTYLERHWDLRGEASLFRPWPHRPNYILPVRWTDDINEAPFAAASPDGTADVQSVEAKFQISFKTKFIQNLFGGPANVWFGYTQQSQFQVYNTSESRPFRETDYEPELLLVFPIRRPWGSWTWRVIGVGLTHQSNGRSDPLSRSWNRLTGIAAVERGNLSIQVRPWVRIDSSDGDDNPTVEDDIGRLEAQLQWIHGKHALRVRGRTNLDVHGHRGSLQTDWYFPVRGELRGQVQVFTGYGESLIDFDHRQTTLGVGFLLFDPF